jgi:hypothetical protein
VRPAIESFTLTCEKPRAEYNDQLREELKTAYEAIEKK